MAQTSFSSQGSNASNPTGGLIPKGPALASNPFGNPNQGLIGSINQATGLAPKSAPQETQPSTYGKVTGVLAPNNTTGEGTTSTTAPTSHTITPDGTITTNTGGTSGTPQPNPNAPVNTTPAGTNGNNGTNFPQNLANVQTASTPNPTYANAIQQGLAVNQGLLQPLTQASMQAGQSPFSGKNQSVGQSVADINRPQSTGNLAGELGNLNNQVSQGLTAEGQQLQGLGAAQQATLQGQQLQTQGAENVAGLTAPQPYGITSTPYNPATNTFGTMPSGASGPAGAGATTQQIQQGGTVQAQTGNQAQAQADTQQLATTISQSGFNSGNGGITTQAINGINQWIQNQSGDPEYQNAYNLINEIASKYSNILNASGGTPTDVSTTTHNIINKLASGQSIQQVIGDLDSNATQSISALKGVAGANAVNTSNGQTPPVTAGGYGFKQINGKWVPA